VNAYALAWVFIFLDIKVIPTTAQHGESIHAFFIVHTTTKRRNAENPTIE
jgi:hypothetical protein